MFPVEPVSWSYLLKVELDGAELLEVLQGTAALERHLGLTPAISRMNNMFFSSDHTVFKSKDQQINDKDLSKAVVFSTTGQDLKVSQP